MESARAVHFCEVCELEFQRESDLKSHEDEHEVCGLEGCSMVASKEVLVIFSSKESSYLQSQYLCSRFWRSTSFFFMPAASTLE